RVLAAPLLAESEAEPSPTSECLGQLVDRNGADLVRMRRRLIIEALTDASPEHVDIEVSIAGPYERRHVDVAAREIRVGVEHVLHMKASKHRTLERERHVRQAIKGRQRRAELDKLLSALLDILPVIGARCGDLRFLECLFSLVLLRELLRFRVVERYVEHHDTGVAAQTSP